MIKHCFCPLITSLNHTLLTGTGKRQCTRTEANPKETSQHEETCKHNAGYFVTIIINQSRADHVSSECHLTLCQSTASRPV